MKLIALLLFPLAVSATCNVGNGIETPCGSHTMIVFDATSLQRGYSNIQQLFNFIQNNLMGAFNLSGENVYFSFGYYGLSNPAVSWSSVYTWFGQSSKAGICSSLSDLGNTLASDNMGSLTVTKVLTSIANLSQSAYERTPYDKVILFTSTNDQTDINNALAQRNKLPNTDFTIVSMGSVDFSNWGNTFVLCKKLPFSSGFENLVIDQACRRNTGNAFCGKPTLLPTTALPTTIAPTTPPTTTTTQKLPTTTLRTTASPSVPTNQCPCVSSQIWNDVFLLVDGSNVLPQSKFDQLTSFVITCGSLMPVGQAEKYQSRMGIILYGNNAQLVSPLNKYANSQDFVMDAVTLTAFSPPQEHTNIKSALDIALDQFQGSGHRAAARKVIVIAASSYREGNYDLPLTTAETFKDNGGVIIVFAYGDLRGETSDVLKQLASPGYFIDGSQSQTEIDPQVFLNLQCKANCFCPSGYGSVNVTLTREPADGCFFSSDLEALQILGKRTCSAEHSGTLAMTKDLAQKNNVLAKYTTRTPVWIGLENVNNQWTWADGTPFTGQIVPGSGNCATLIRPSGFNSQIRQEECLSGGAHNYACQATPCSSTNYCSAN